jgi:hypothetical protein
MIRLLLPASIPINPNVANELRIGSVPCLQLATPFQKLIPSDSMPAFEKFLKNPLIKKNSNV